MKKRDCLIRMAANASLSAILVALAVPANAQAQDGENNVGTGASQQDFGDDIVVTATRSEQSLSKVPLSVSAFSQDKLDTLGVKTIADIASLTPGVTFNQRKSISIRGIASNAGAGTTGIYIDDTPVQVYKAGAYVTDAVPALFDLERVEVLRGPQGTLFGSGSMGGTIRYITPQPSVNDFSVYIRGELSATDGGQPNYEGGISIGGPLVEDKVGLRASAYYRRDGGWIDRVDRHNGGVVVDKGANWGDSYALRGALTFKPADGIEITPAIFHHSRYDNQGQGLPIATGDGTSASWEGFSDPDKGIFRSGARIKTPTEDTFTLYSLTAKFDIGGGQLVSNSSYYDRVGTNIIDSSVFDATIPGLFPGATATPTNVFVPGVAEWDSYSPVRNTQRSFAQEIRYQSDTEKPLRYVVGAFYERNRQFNIETYISPSLLRTSAPGAFLLPGDISYYGLLRSKNSQIAGFAQVDYDVTDTLSVISGIRYAKLKFSFYGENDGYYNGGFGSSSGDTQDTAWTPKVGIQWEPDDKNLFYATAAKGFRTGGANAPIGASCDADLENAGFTDGMPDTYGADNVWNYEIGAKNKLFDNRLQLASSVYRVDWSGIQSRVLLRCGFLFVANLGEARSEGFDVQLSARLADWFSLSGNIGYNDARYLKTIATSPTVNLVTKGDKLPISPWTATISGDLDFDLGTRSTYVHAEYRYQSGFPQLIEQNPVNATFDPNYYDRPAVHLVFLRAGMRFDDLDISVFANNLFNSRTTIGRASDNGSPIYLINNLDPRVIGLTVTYRQ